ncbi:MULTISPECIES: amino acid ABC transporter substrate-binding protein [unclassified Adlercreutzia]|uniref:amino acid ABC transporter substrate-binding protein n=1 Tax=unclassified Adlercreutzia TaxID=2636013 RepID=UPI0013EC647D|nr:MULTISPECIES: amino acid ABC transporter substrate-binding protein [unclassified Adlercreutzia]
MKKKITTLVAAVAVLSLSALMLAGCSSSNASSSAASSASSAADKAATETTKLVVGFDNAYPPYGFIGDDGKETGFDLDLAAEVAKRNGWEYEQQAIDWDAKDALLNQGTINCIWNGFTMEGREADYTFSEPYMLNEQVIVVKKGSDVKALEDLAGKTVITQVDSAALDVLENDEEGGQAALAATFAELQTIGDYNNAFMQLESGMVDAVACDLSIAAYQMSANPDAYVQIEEPLSSEHYAVGVKKGDTEMADQITATLKEMYEDGTVEELCKKYEEYGLTFDNWILK